MLLIFTFQSESDREKFEYLYHKYKRLFLHKAYGILHDYSLAEDAVSEAMIRIYRNLHKIEDADSPRTVSFLMTIVRNVSLTLLRKRGNLPEAPVPDDEPAAADVENTVLSGVMAESLYQVIDTLKEELKAPFLLKYAHNLSHAEISRILDISENNVTVRIHRARAKLAAMLEKGGIVDEG